MENPRNQWLFSSPGWLSQLVLCKCVNPEEAGSNISEGMPPGYMNLPLRLRASRQKAKAAFAFLHVLQIGCHQKVWVFKVGGSFTSNELTKKNPIECGQQLGCWLISGVVKLTTNSYHTWLVSVEVFCSYFTFGFWQASFWTCSLLIACTFFSVLLQSLHNALKSSSYGELHYSSPTFSFTDGAVCPI